jgi:VWFA-related protein
MKRVLPLLLAFLPAAAPAQFGEQVTVRLVEVPVRVADAAGNAIVRLPREEFTLLEDGVPQEITHFYEVADSAIARRQFADFVRERGLPVREPDTRKRVILFLDAVRLHPLRYQRLVGALEGYLATALVAGDEVAVFGAQPSLKTLVPWTADPEKVKVFLRAYTPPGSGALSRVSKNRMVQEMVMSTRSYQAALATVRGHCLELRNEYLGSIEAMRAVLEFTAGLPGRKTFLYLGEGFTTIPGLEFFYLLEKRWPSRPSLNEAFTYDLSPAFRELGVFAASKGFTLHAVETRGLLQDDSATDVEVRALDDVYGLDVGAVAAARRAAHDSLVLMASPSGGRVVDNTNDAAAPLGRTALESNHYYILAYQPRHPADGRPHALSVAVRDPAFRVTARAGFIDFTPEDELASRLQSAVVWDTPLENPLGLKAELGEGRKEGKLYLVPLRVLLPREGMIFSGGLTALRLGVITASGGKKSDSFIQKLSLEESSWGDKAVLAYQVTLKMRKGEHDLVAAVQQEDGRVSLVKIKAVGAGK